jgi:hypothetical protein
VDPETARQMAKLFEQGRKRKIEDERKREEEAKRQKASASASTSTAAASLLESLKNTQGPMLKGIGKKVSALQILDPR